ncbi:DNA-binding transcriptional LysR family regulator [Bradyrhizobium sp. USDA 4369]
MEDLNDIYYFTSVVEHDGFSAAARAIGIEKTRLSRHVSNLETRLGVRLLQRSTRRIALTEAGQAFYERSQLIVESAKAAYDSVQQLKKEPAGSVRVLCPVVLAQSYLAPILPGYMAAHPKVTVFIEASDRMANPADERFDLALRARPDIEDSSGLVAREVGRARRILVASPDFLNRHGRPRQPDELSNVNILSNATDVHEGAARWLLTGSEQQLTRLQLRPKLISSDLRVQFQAATHGIGIALLPEPIAVGALQNGTLEQVLPGWYASDHIIHLVYPPPRGMLPSVRSLIDYLLTHLPLSILERSVS